MLIPINKYLFWGIFLAIATLSSCSQASKDCLKSAGEIDSTTFELEKFTIIDVYDIFNVYVKQADNYSIKIKTNSTLLNNVEISLEDTILTITDKNKCYFTRDYNLEINIFITAPNLRKINFYNASTLISQNTLNYERFLFRAYGKLAFCDIDVNCSDHFFLSLWNVSGEFKVTGQCKYFEILNHGTSYIHAYEMDAEYVWVEQKSLGDVEINASKKIFGDIYDIGNIYYIGNPEIDSNIIGTGKFIKSD